MSTASFSQHNMPSCMCAKSFRSCLTLCDPMDCSPPGSSVHGILQAGILEWVSCSPPGDFPDPGIEPTSLTSTRIGRQVLYHLPHLGRSNMTSGSLKCGKQSFESSDNVFRFPTGRTGSESGSVYWKRPCCLLQCDLDSFDHSIFWRQTCFWQLLSPSKTEEDLMPHFSISTQTARRPCFGRQTNFSSYSPLSTFGNVLSICKHLS